MVETSRPVVVKPEMSSSNAGLSAAADPTVADPPRGPAFCSTCLVFGYNRLSEGTCPSCNANPMCNRCKNKNVCMNCRELEEGYDASKDPRYATETTERAICCAHGKTAAGLTSSQTPMAPSSAKTHNHAPCQKTGRKTKAKAKEKRKTKRKQR